MAGIDTPMVFEQLRDGIIALLTANQSGRFVTVGNQKQSTDATEVKGILRTVQVFFSQGDYPKSKSAFGSPSHDVTFNIVYTASSPAKGDKAVLESDSSTEPQVQAALLAIQEGESLVDQSIDELRRMVTQILMDPTNENFGLAIGAVSDPWLQNFQKTAPLEKGRLVVLKASETFTANVDETLAGATPTPAEEPAIDLTNDQRPIDEGAGTAPLSGMQTEQ
jgi:hypothetical protein